MKASKIQTFVQSTLGNAIQHHSPKFIARGLNFAYHALVNRFEFNNRNGVDIFAEDWDTLVILDACRYDMFAEQNTLPGTLEARVSKGSSTVEFLEANFTNKDLRDTVYVTGNPQYYNNHKRINANFHNVQNIWMEDGWDSESGTVLPRAVTEAALKAHDQYPNKRIIIHYIQPHFPFIGSDVGKGSFEHEDDELNIWEKLFTGELEEDNETIWNAYNRNLAVTLPHVERLLKNVDGRTVVTADHGNLVGERVYPIPIKEWGHPRGLYVQPLIKVPWLVTESKNRRETTPGEVVTKDQQSNAAEERLKQLGYV
ncbi:hypothetical protein EXE43_10430 [Halorubrum sp. SS5]|nr:hypothetical protein EXE43_10430 [Halorubrum sp. SS5]